MYIRTPRYYYLLILLSSSNSQLLRNAHGKMKRDAKTRAGAGISHCVLDFTAYFKLASCFKPGGGGQKGRKAGRGR